MAYSAFRQQDISRDDVDQILCRHMVPLGTSELNELNMKHETTIDEW